jgi:hypothetical protein
MVLVGNLMSCPRVKSETETVTPNTAFRFNSKDNFQDSNKRKSTEKKTFGYLPRVLFFNAFELGAENCESSNIKR